MARKKGSRVQLLIPRRIVSYRIAIKPSSPLMWRAGDPHRLMGALISEQALWATSLPSPLLLSRSRVRLTVWAPHQLLWV